MYNVIFIGEETIVIVKVKIEENVGFFLRVVRELRRIIKCFGVSDF